jgi:hypothetical protein
MSLEFERIVAAAQRRQLSGPLLLLLASHRPLAFVAGQLLYVAAPLAGLLGWRSVDAWAAWLSAAELPSFAEGQAADSADAGPRGPFSVV